MTLISIKDDRRRRLKFITVSIAAWGGIAALFSLQRLYAVAATGVVPVWSHLALEMSVMWGTWAILTPLIFFIVRRLPLPSAHLLPVRAARRARHERAPESRRREPLTWTGS